MHVDFKSETRFAIIPACVDSEWLKNQSQIDFLTNIDFLTKKIKKKFI